MSQQHQYRKLKEFISTEGPEYEKAILTFVYTWCLNNDIEFHLASNMKLAKAFDDVVLLIRNATNEKALEQEYSLLLLQATHKQSRRPTRKEMLCMVPRKGTIEKFYVNKLFQSSLELEPSKIIEELGVSVNSFNVVYGLCSNARLDGPVMGLGSYRENLPRDLSAKIGSVESFSLEDEDIKKSKKMPRWMETENAQKLKNFFERFRFFHGHDSADFDHLAADELEALFGPDARQIFPELKDRISKWWDKRDASVEVLTRTTGPAAFISWSVLNSLSAEYLKSQVSMIIFNKDCLEKCRSLLERCGDEITFLADKGASSFTACKIHQALSNKLHIIGNVETLQQHEKTVVRMWRRHCPWLVVVEEAGEDARPLLQRLPLSTGRSRVLVTERKLHGAVVDSCVPADLSPQTLHALPQLRVSLQGDEYTTTLGDLLPDMAAITQLLEGNGYNLLRLLSEAVNGQPLRLGQPLPTVDKWHVPRKLVSHRALDGDRFLRSLGTHDVCVTDDISVDEVLRVLGRSTGTTCKDAVNIVTSSKTKWPLVFFGEDVSLVYQKFVDKNIYEIIYTSSGWELLRCNKRISHIRNYLLCRDNQDEETYSERKNSESFIDLTDKVIIIEGKPGVGKSSLLTSVAVQIKEKDARSWVLRINLLSYTKPLKNLGDCKAIIRIILADALSTRNTINEGLELTILQQCLKYSSNAVILLDGFDEISPDYTEKCYEIIESLTHQCRCLCVTTRPTVVRELEDKLGVVAYTLEMYSVRELQAVFCKYKESGLINEVLDANQLNEQFRNILRIPLFAKIYADLVAAGKLEGHDPVTLFEEFFEMKYQRLFEEKYSADLSVPGARVQMDYDRKAYVSELMHLAINSIMDYRVTSLDEPAFKHKLSYFLKPGIVFDFVDERPVFLHRTFAEFFLAKWCNENIDNCGEVFKICYLEYKLEFFLECFTRLSCRGKNLHEAVINNDTQVVTDLLSLDAETLTMQIDHSGRNALHLAVIHDRWKMVRIIARVHTKSQLVCDRVLGWTPLDYAQSAERWGIIDSLLQAGLSVDHLRLEMERKNYKTKKLEEIFLEEGYPALVRTIIPRKILLHPEADVKMAIFLIRRQFKAKSLSKDGKSLLQCALEYGHREVVRTLIIAGANLTTKSADGSTILHSAVERGDTSIVKLLLEAGLGNGEAHVDWPAMLRLAVENQHLQVVENLAAAMLDSPRRSGWTTLHLAAACGHILVLSALLDARADAQAKDIEGSSALHVAASHGHAEAAQLLLQRGCSPDDEDDNGNTPLAVAASRKHFTVVEVLAAAILELPRRPEWSYLQWAAASGDAKAVKALVSVDEDINSVDLDGSTALHLAAAGGHEEVVKLLLQWDADPRIEDSAGRIPLVVSAKQGRVQIVNCLADAMMNSPPWTERIYLHHAAHKRVIQIINCLADGMMSGWSYLHHAAYNGDVQMLKALLRGSSSSAVLDVCGCSPLLIAAVTNHVPCARHLLVSGVDVDLSNIRGTTPLMVAAQGQPAMLNELLSWNADVGAVDKEGQTALHKAAADNQPECARLLIAAGVDREHVDKEGRTALLVAAALGHKEVVQALMMGGCRAEAKHINGFPELHTAISTGQVQTALVMIEQNADIEVKDNNGLTMIAFAARKGQTQVVEELLGLVLSPREENWSSLHWMAFVGDDQTLEEELMECDDTRATVVCGLSALHVAAARGWPNVVKKLLLWGLSAAAPDSSGWTPLHYAAACADKELRLDTVKALLVDSAADVMLEAPSGDSALSLAALSKRLDVTTALARSCLLRRAIRGWSYLHWAVYCRNSKVTEALVAAGHDVNFKDEEDRATALHIAAAEFYVEGAKILKESQADLEVKDSSGCTPLVVAALRGHGEMMLFLMKAGADANSLAQFGYTHLHIETMKGDVERVSWILENGGNVNELTSELWTPIMIAACIGNLKMVKCLVSYGADLSKTNLIKWTALHYAARNGPPQVVEYLIEQNSDMNAEDVKGWKPIHVAARYSDPKVVSALLDAGADPQERVTKILTPLLLATAAVRTLTVELLLEVGASVEPNIMHSLANDEPADGDEASRPQVACLLLRAGATVTSDMVLAARRWRRHKLAYLLQEAAREVNQWPAHPIWPDSWSQLSRLK